MSNKVINLGVVGVGKIVRDQHLPSIAKNSRFELVATASRNATVEGIQAFTNIESMLESTKLDAVALCMPPQYRRAAAKLALEKGKHVLLEKPPGATVSEVEQLAKIAVKNGVSLYTTWHSRHGAAVEAAKKLLSQRTLLSASLVWKENVKKWHPGQEWIWQAGGLGVFDPGINGLSILSHCLRSPAYVDKAKLVFPSNKAAPIAAQLEFRTDSNVKITGDFDWGIIGGEAWQIDFQTDDGLIQIKDGGSRLLHDGRSIEVPAHSEHGEYEAIYARFEEIIQAGVSDVDLTPLKLVADAFMLGNREETAAFYE